MQTHQSFVQTKKLGDVIAAAYAMSDVVAPDRATANELAARRLERVLARGSNMRLVAALRGLARELAPARARAARPDVQGTTWTLPPLAVAR
jgi:hypothetical protein